MQDQSFKHLMRVSLSTSALNRKYARSPETPICSPVSATGQTDALRKFVLHQFFAADVG
jgi:hypothetical protein